MESLLRWEDYELPNGKTLRVRELLDDEKGLLRDTEGDGQRELLVACVRDGDSQFFADVRAVKQCPARVTLDLLNLVIRASGFASDEGDEGKA